jgi:hypothetical protein
MAKQNPACFRYVPPGDSPQSPAFNPLIGEIVPGGVYEVPSQHIALFNASRDWEPAKKSDSDVRRT